MVPIDAALKNLFAQMTQKSDLCFIRSTFKLYFLVLQEKREQSKPAPLSFSIGTIQVIWWLELRSSYTYPIDVDLLVSARIFWPLGLYPPTKTWTEHMEHVA